MSGRPSQDIRARVLIRLIGGCSALALALPATASAQESPGPAKANEIAATNDPAAETRTEPVQADDISEGEIVVTAQKRSQSLSDVPLSITAYTGDQLLARGVVDVQSLVKVTPGLSFVESGNASPVYSLRGVGFFDTSIGARPAVSVYLDEVPLPFSIMSMGVALDLERVEVIKGPQGTLFGQNSTGGAINYIAAKPTAAFGGGATLSYASFNTIDASAYLSGPLTSTLRARISVRGLHGDDWQRSYTRKDSIGAKRLLQGRLLLDWAPTDRFSLALNINGFRDRSDTQAAQLTEILLGSNNPEAVPLMLSYPLAPRDDRAADWNPDQDLSRRNDFYQLSLRGDYRIGDDLTLTSITAYSHMKVDQLVDQDGTALTNAELHVTGALRSFSQELRLAGRVGPAQFVIGGNYERDQSNESNFLDIDYSTYRRRLPTGPLRSFNLASEQDFNSKALFGSVDVDLTDTIVAHGGIRYTKADLDYAACTRVGDATSATTLTTLYNILRSRAGLTPLAPIAVNSCVTLDPTLTPAQLVDSLDQDNVSWRVGIDWKPAPQALLYASISRGYKSGSVPTPNALGTAGYRPVTQETVLAYEVGFKVPVVHRVLEATGALFYYDYTDKQVLGRILVPPVEIGALSALVNVPRSRVLGVEFQLNAYPVRGLSLSLAGTYLDSKVIGNFVNFTILAQQTNFRDNPFPYTPKFQLVGDVQYEAPVSNSVQGFFGAGFSYRSSTTSGFGDVANLNIKDYALLDLRVGARGPQRKWQMMLFMRNVTNTYYWTNVARLTDTIRRYTGEPRTVGIQFSTKF